MEFSDDIFIKIGILVLGLCGFMVARHIRNHKIENKPLVCPIGFDCHAVVHSDYSKFLGMSVEFLGMIYYASISLVYLIIIFLPMSGAMSADVTFLMTIVALFALVFSIYLILVQIFILKKGCSWCLISSIISASIFVLSILI